MKLPEFAVSRRKQVHFLDITVLLLPGLCNLNFKVFQINLILRYHESSGLHHSLLVAIKTNKLRFLGLFCKWKWVLGFFILLLHYCQQLFDIHEAFGVSVHVVFKLNNLLSVQICVLALPTIKLATLIPVLFNCGQNPLHLESEALFDRFTQILNIISQVLDLLKVVVLLFVVMESSNYVPDLLHVFKTEIFKVPVTHYESEVVLNFDLVGNSSSVSERFTHDGDKHVQKMDQQDKR